jgi:S-DNA-T family DNA segregation ATPase FtsK/SpoIIIE
MIFTDLDKTVRRSVSIPTLRRVRADGWRDRVTLTLLPGQTPTQFAARAEALAHSFGATTCQVRTIRPRRIVLDLVHSDPLARPINPPPLPTDGTAVPDLRRLVIGRSETGRPWRVQLHGSHLLAVGATGAGKASLATLRGTRRPAAEADVANGGNAMWAVGWQEACTCLDFDQLDGGADRNGG